MKRTVLTNVDELVSITSKAIPDFLDELEASRQARRAWDVVQDLRAVLTKLGNVAIEVPSRKTFEAKGAHLKFFRFGDYPLLPSVRIV